MGQPDSGSRGRIVSFVLNATHNSVMTPDLHHICGYVAEPACQLCRTVDKATLHILADCRVALEDHRYTWRHDSVIATLLQAIQPALLSHNSKPTATMLVPAISSFFVRAGASPKRSKRACLNRSLLGSVSDWKLLVNFRHKPCLFSPQRPRNGPTS